MRLDCFGPLLKFPGICWHSLQVGAAAEELAMPAFAGRIADLGRRFASYCGAGPRHRGGYIRSASGWSSGQTGLGNAAFRRGLAVDDWAAGFSMVSYHDVVSPTQAR